MAERVPLHDYSRSRAVIIGAWDFVYLPPVRPARNSFDRMVRLLTGGLCDWPEDRLVTMANEARPGDIADQLITAFDDVTDVALFYYVGHGQVDYRNQLCLALTESVPDPRRRASTSLPFSAVSAALDCDAATKIVILDCCYAAIVNRLGAGTQAAPTDVIDKTIDTGAYTMAATSANDTAWFEDDPSLPFPQTFFTKYFVDLIERGMEGEPAGLRLDPIFRRLRADLAGAGRPVPQSRSVDAARDFVFARNAAPKSTQRDPLLEVEKYKNQLNDVKAQLAAANEKIDALTAATAEALNDRELFQMRQARETKQELTERQHRLEDQLQSAEMGKDDAESAATATAVSEAPAAPVALASEVATLAAAPAEAPSEVDDPPQLESSLAETPSDTPRPKRRGILSVRPRVALLVVTACIVFGLAAVLLRLLLPSPSHLAHATATSTSYSFPARQYSDGLVITRHWTLSGPGGSQLTEQLTVSNVSGTALHLQFKEPIPAAISASLATVQFSPEIPKIIGAGHVFEWAISLAAGEREVLTYKAKVAPHGIANSRIALMAGSFDTAAATLRQPVSSVQLRSLKITATTIRVKAGRSVRITLTGTMSNGMKASADVLAMVTWVVTNPNIAKVNAIGRLTGLAPGRTRVTARFDGVSASAKVVVSPGTSPGQAPGGSTGQGTQQTPNPGSSSSSSSSHHSTPPNSTPTITPTMTL